mmetsp:Transcript_26289/g.66924  ORF Transcript_26289/g.66924 Transcript_26289/m.66924 type:complete len:242 (-) Transcript_26289:474-1199(-)
MEWWVCSSLIPVSMLGLSFQRQAYSSCVNNGTKASTIAIGSNGAQTTTEQLRHGATGSTAHIQSTASPAYCMHVPTQTPRQHNTVRTNAACLVSTCCCHDARSYICGPARCLHNHKTGSAPAHSVVLPAAANPLQPPRRALTSALSPGPTQMVSTAALHAPRHSPPLLPPTSCTRIAKPAPIPPRLVQGAAALTQMPRVTSTGLRQWCMTYWDTLPMKNSVTAFLLWLAMTTMVALMSCAF